MPRNGINGAYSLPEAAFVPGTTISSAAVNDDFSDIALALTASIAADGQTPITGQMKGIAGSLATPSWSFTGDAASGMYLPGVGAVALGAGGAIGLQVSSVGFVGSVAVIAVGGSGYVVGELITLTGGTVLRNTILQVATLSGSAVATVTIADVGLYSTVPPNAVAQGSTSGVGTGATFTMTWIAGNFIGDNTGNSLWLDLGATTYMAGAMNLYNGLALANYIGAANLAAAISTSLPVPAPQGYLTLTNNTNPILTADAIAATTIYYSPLIGLWNPIHNGTSLVPYALSGQLSLTLTASQSANGIYDIFLAYNGNNPVIGTGPSWTAGAGGSVTPGACARGTGAGGTALTRLQGVNVNAASMSLIYNIGAGNVTITVGANQGVYLGSIYIDATAGQVTCHRSYGQNRKWGVWNEFNRTSLFLKGGDPASTWAYSTNTVRASNAVPLSYSANNYNVGSGTTVNGLVVFSGLSEEIVHTKFKQKVGSSSSSSIERGTIGIGLNSTTAQTGTGASVGSTTINSSFANAIEATVEAQYDLLPSATSLGVNNIQATETAPITGGTSSFFGTEPNMVLSAAWRG